MTDCLLLTLLALPELLYEAAAEFDASMLLFKSALLLTFFSAIIHAF